MIREIENVLNFGSNSENISFEISSMCVFHLENTGPALFLYEISVFPFAIILWKII
jgi:hypothetical protein